MPFGSASLEVSAKSKPEPPKPNRRRPLAIRLRDDAQSAEGQLSAERELLLAVSRRSKKPGSKRAARPRKRRQRMGVRRFVLLFVLALIALLYAGPLRTYYDKHELVSRQRTQVELLRANKQELERKLRQASTRQAAEREARRLFYVKPGEHLYIVKGIEDWRKNRARLSVTSP